MAKLPGILRGAAEGYTPDSSADLFEMVTPSDTDDLKFATRQVTQGDSPAVDVTVLPATAKDDSEVVTIAAAIWAVEPVQNIRVRRVMQTGTDASSIFVKY